MEIIVESSTTCRLGKHTKLYTNTTKESYTGNQTRKIENPHQKSTPKILPYKLTHPVPMRRKKV